MRVLIAEDDEATAIFTARGLQDLGHVTTIAPTGDEALRRLCGESYDVAVLDRMLPGIDGLSLLQQARANGCRTPALMLTALGRIEDRVDGLEAGADDYLVKPFALSELAARLNAILRRQSAGDDPTSLSAGPLTMDLLHREVACAGRAIPLQPREIRLLEEMMRHAGRIVTRTMLLETVWGFHFDPQTNLVETHMSRLRAKLALGGARDIIETVRGAGYRLRVED
ncbi:response regulator transcription factor [Sphingomonas sp. PR090111-T3T-6A]|uniref:response regulator transcription factor n=1 Tax=Sphingomonas sp. PR090111-T3T-6A TaxID=685778 RepID=UPI00037546A4|nr:response regulator transcription factor [Sphingomonas sp. PR090111-T3T-6A]